MSHIKEKQAEQEPQRMEYAVKELQNLGFEVVRYGNTRLEFEYKGHMVKFWPYTGWASGKMIKDGRGIKNLLKQLK